MQRKERRTVPEYVKEIDRCEKGYMGKWRVDFSVGYAERIAARLAEIKRESERQATDTDRTGTLLPALRDRSAEVARYVAAQAGAPRKMRAKTYNADAIDRGGRAADRADLGQTGVGGSHKRLT